MVIANLENSLYGVSLYGQDVFTNDSINTTDGVYFTKIFKKESYELWHKIEWLDNSSVQTLDKFKIEIRTRTGSGLPYNYTTNLYYTLDQINNIIKTQNINVIDTMLERFMVGRSILSNTSYSTVGVNTPQVLPLGTNQNSTQLPSDKDPIWNYWSNPIINSPSFIPLNNDFNYLQARIYLQSRDNIILPEMFRINFSSILKN